MIVDKPYMNITNNVATVANPPVQYEVLKLENPLSSILKQVWLVEIASYTLLIFLLEFVDRPLS